MPSDFDAEDWGDPPAQPRAAPVPPTPRMRQNERRRARTLAGVAHDRADLAITAAAQTNPAVLDSVLSQPPSLVQERRDAMALRFRQAGVTLADIRLEMLEVARTAAAEGEYQAAGAIYKTIAQTLGGLQDNHLHLHGQMPANPSDPRADFRATPDDALRALIAEARASGAIIDPRSRAAAPEAQDVPALVIDASAPAQAP
jgi:hypothetical protein